MLNINIMPGASSAASALSAEKVRMDVIGQNIANAGTTTTPDGGPYTRQVVRFETVLANQFNPASAVQEVRVAGIENDTRPFRHVYQPGHPDADKETGMVKFPNVPPTMEGMKQCFALGEEAAAHGGRTRRHRWHTHGLAALAYTAVHRCTPLYRSSLDCHSILEGTARVPRDVTSHRRPDQRD